MIAENIVVQILMDRQGEYDRTIDEPAAEST